MTPMSEETDTARVIQADRDAAAKVYDLLGFGPCQHIIDGVEDDIGVVQAFARHRISQAAPAGDVTWATASDDQRERAQLLADVELHLQPIRVFITSRQKSHPCGVVLHDELLAKVAMALDAIGRENVRG